jgi:hypothetical protein
MLHRLRFPISARSLRHNATSTPPALKEFQFFNEFLVSEINYNDVILQESHLKHGISTNLPPQMPPPGSPPMVPMPLFCEALKQKLLRDPPIYQPTHAPPPIETTGSKPKVVALKSHPVAKGAVAGAAVTSDSKSASTSLLPTAEEVEELISVWDQTGAMRFEELGKGAAVEPFKPSASFVTAVTDSTLVTARMLRAQNQADPSSGGSPQTVYMLQKRFPNPLGEDTANPQGGLGTDFVSPFVKNVEGPEAKQNPTFRTNTILKRNFPCHLCGKSFRLLEALVSHYATQHMTTIPSDHLAALKNGGLKPASESAARSTTESLPRSSEVEQGNRSGPDTQQTESQLHMRCATSMSIVGRVESVASGYLKREAVVQLLVSVEAGKEMETFTVRLFGDAFHKLYSAPSAPGNAEERSRSILQGKFVFIEGSLKLNRHVDEVSRKAHAYPFVQVVPPFGQCVIIE